MRSNWLCEYGLVTRGSSWMRRTELANSIVVSAGPVVPVIGGRLLGLRGADQRDVALAGEQAGGRVQPDPAGPGHVDLGPGVQVGEVLGQAAGGTVERSSGTSWTR